MKGNTVSVKVDRIEDWDDHPIDGVILSTHKYLDDNGAGKWIASTDWYGGFTLKFPQTVASDQLVQIGQMFAISGTWKGETSVSDPDAMVCEGRLYGIKEQWEEYQFYVTKSSGEGYWRLYYIYSDRPVTLSGEYTFESNPAWTYAHDLRLKKGWNEVVLYRASDDADLTTGYSMSVPAGMSWRFDHIWLSYPNYPVPHD